VATTAVDAALGPCAFEATTVTEYCWSLAKPVMTHAVDEVVHEAPVEVEAT
jgi:hypothetical protein